MIAIIVLVINFNYYSVSFTEKVAMSLVIRITDELTARELRENTLAMETLTIFCV